MDGSYNPRTVEEVFRDFKGRRAGLLKALTTGSFSLPLLFFYIQFFNSTYVESNIMLISPFFFMLQMLKTFLASVTQVKISLSLYIISFYFSGHAYCWWYFGWRDLKKNEGEEEKSDSLMLKSLHFYFLVWTSVGRLTSVVESFDVCFSFMQEYVWKVVFNGVEIWLFDILVMIFNKYIMCAFGTILLLSSLICAIYFFSREGEFVFVWLSQWALGG